MTTNAAFRALLTCLAWLGLAGCGKTAPGPRRPAAPKLVVRQVPLHSFVEGAVIETLTLSPDVRRFAYVARRGETSCLVIDGTAQAPRDEIGAGSLTFSPDARRFAFAARRDDAWRLVADGVEGPAWDEIGEVRFSDDGARLAYAVRRGRTWRLVVDGAESPPYDAVVSASIAFGPRGRRVAYGAVRDRRAFVVVDGVPAKKTHERLQAGSVGFSPDGKRLAYVAKEGGRVLAVIDGAEGRPYESVAERGIVFGPAGRRTAYVARRGEETFAVIDTVEVGPFSQVAKPGVVFAPDGRYAFLAVRDNETSLVTPRDRQFVGKGIVAGYLALSPDGASWACVVREGFPWRVVRDGQGLPEYDSIAPRTMTFAPDGRHLAYRAVLGNRSVVVVDDLAGAPAKPASLGIPLAFDSPSHLHTLALDGKQLLRVDVRIVTE